MASQLCVDLKKCVKKKNCERLECLRCGFTVGVFTVAYRIHKKVFALLLGFYGYLQDGLKSN
jgi:hypothetical protein